MKLNQGNMKNIKTKSFLFFSLLFLSVNSIYSQDLIYHDKVNTNQLKEIFDNAYITVVETTDEYVKIKDQSIVYVDVYPTTKYLTLSLTFSLKKDTSKTEISELLNKLNKEVVMIKAWYNEANHSIVFSYYVWLDGGIAPKTFISTVKFFQLAMNLALTKDVNKIIL